MKRILVTGGAGFIGSNLCKFLLEKGHRVISLDNYSTGNKSNHIKGVKYIKGDILDIDQINPKCELLFHLAALPRIQPSFNRPSETFKVNVIGTERILEWSRLKNIKVVYAGSSSKHVLPYSSPYSSYKRIGEELCKTYKLTYGCDIEIARFYNVYGPNELMKGEMATVIGKFRQAILDKVPLPIIGDGRQTRDFTHVDDIVDGLWRIGMKNEKHDDAWELGANHPISINELADMFNYKLKPDDREYLPNQMGNYTTSSQTNQDANNILKWSPKHKVKNYVKDFGSLN